ncbi:hypothetical protein BH23GEM6_BH23GEM6_24950 [soil metagenome]
MGNSFLSRRAGSLAASLSVLLLASCEATPSGLSAEDPLLSRSGVPTRSHGDLLRAVRQETSRFNSTTQAIRAGYQADTHCVAVPGLGGMGYHWVNEGLIDPVFDPMRPEVLLYGTGPGGNLRLIGVEYIVINVGQPHPSFDGHPFDVGGVPPLMAAGIPHWSLHVWIHEVNPNGLFTPFNPNVSCP